MLAMGVVGSWMGLFFISRWGRDDIFIVAVFSSALQSLLDLPLSFEFAVLCLGLGL